MGKWNERANEVFLQALEAPEDRRAIFLDDACADDSTLRRQVDELLSASARAEKFMEQPLLAPAARPDDWFADGSDGANAEVHRDSILFAGKYRVGEKLGTGGMGVVYVAEQTEPIKRRVAIKFIKDVVDTQKVLARFEQERQALALMDHPNIAKVLDAASPRPESRFWSWNSSTRPDQQIPRRRQAHLARAPGTLHPSLPSLQHAHQKGIIHRDLKPSNVLVGTYDGRPTPRIIDFGVAKVTGPRIIDSTVESEPGLLDRHASSTCRRNSTHCKGMTWIRARTFIRSALSCMSCSPACAVRPRAAAQRHLSTRSSESCAMRTRRAWRTVYRPTIPCIAAAASPQIEPRKLLTLVTDDLD